MSLRGTWGGLAVAAAVLLTGRCLAQSTPMPPGPDPELRLSWNLPYGQPGASDTLLTMCNDTTRVDTLYLSFVSGGRPRPVRWMRGVLYFHPQAPDTLGPFWWFKRGWANESNLQIGFDRFMQFPCVLPWDWIGIGNVTYDHRSGRGRLDLEFKMPVGGQGKVLSPEEPYCFAKVMILQKKSGLRGCDQPVCIEFASATLGFPNQKTQEITQGAHRMVRWNARGGSPCSSEPPSAVKPWRPPPAVTEQGSR